MFQQGLKKINVKYDPTYMFFEGSQVYSSRPIPGLEKLPVVLVAGGGNEDNKKTGSEVDEYLSIEKCTVLGAPKDVLTISTPAGGTPEGYVASDPRCGYCNRTFRETQSLMQHCERQAHKPAVKTDSVPATNDDFLNFCNIALKRALNEKLMRWGDAYIDPRNYRDEEGVRIFDAYYCEFSLIRSNKEKGKLSLALTADVRVKLQRSKTLLDMLAEINPSAKTGSGWRESDMKTAQRRYEGECVIYTIDKRTFDIVKLHFNESADSKMVDQLNISHAEYFEKKKKMKLKYPKAKPLVEVFGRNKSSIFLPPEVICCNELDPYVKQKLPTFASFRPAERHEKIEKVKKYLIPGGQKQKELGNLLPSMGIILEGERIKCRVRMLPIPLVRAGTLSIKLSKDKTFWSPQMGNVDYQCSHGSIDLCPVVIHPRAIDPKRTLSFISKEINQQRASYRIGQKHHFVVHSGKTDDHWRAVSNFFRNNKGIGNVVVIDMTKPFGHTTLDPAYSIVKSILSEGGILSQFINFKVCDHHRADKKSSQILYAVCRQMLAKCGVRIWWVSIPREVPTPAVFIGVDVYHAPRVFDLKTKKRLAKKSCAACVIQVIRSHDASKKIEVYTETLARDAGVEIHLGDFLQKATSNALKTLKVDPKSCFVWRDGVGDNVIDQVAKDEIPHIRSALAKKAPVGVKSTAPSVPLSYIICQVGFCAN